MAIRHREQFPEGSSPDSIDWRVWNDDHVGVAGSITQDQQDALDAANAPDAGNPFATIADVGGGGAVAVYKKRVLFSDPTTELGGNTVIEDFYHLPAGKMLLGGSIIIVEGFDDTNAASNAPSIENSLNDQIIIAAATNDMSVADTFPQGFMPLSPSTLAKKPNSIIVADPVLGADLLFFFGTGLAGDGTTGIADVYFIVGTATAI